MQPVGQAVAHHLDVGVLLEVQEDAAVADDVDRTVAVLGPQHIGVFGDDDVQVFGRRTVGVGRVGTGEEGPGTVAQRGGDGTRGATPDPAELVVHLVLLVAGSAVLGSAVGIVVGGGPRLGGRLAVIGREDPLGDVARLVEEDADRAIAVLGDDTREHPLQRLHQLLDRFAQDGVLGLEVGDPSHRGAVSGGGTQRTGDDHHILAVAQGVELGGLAGRDTIIGGVRLIGETEARPLGDRLGHLAQEGAPSRKVVLNGVDRVGHAEPVEGVSVELVKAVRQDRTDRLEAGFAGHGLVGHRHRIGQSGGTRIAQTDQLAGDRLVGRDPTQRHRTDPPILGVAQGQPGQLPARKRGNGRDRGIVHREVDVAGQSEAVRIEMLDLPRGAVQVGRGDIGDRGDCAGRSRGLHEGSAVVDDLVAHEIAIDVGGVQVDEVRLDESGVVDRILSANDRIVQSQLVGIVRPYRSSDHTFAQLNVSA